MIGISILIHSVLQCATLKSNFKMQKTCNKTPITAIKAFYWRTFLLTFPIHLILKGYHLSITKLNGLSPNFNLSITNTNHFFITKLNCSSPNSIHFQQISKYLIHQNAQSSQWNQESIIIEKKLVWHWQNLIDINCVPLFS